MYDTEEIGGRHPADGRQKCCRYHRIAAPNLMFFRISNRLNIFFDTKCHFGEEKNMKNVFFMVFVAFIAHFSFAQSNAPLVTHGNFVTRGNVLVGYTGNERSVTIPDNLNITEIGASIFSHARVETVVIPSGITSIGKGAFASCYSLKTVVIPATVKVIDDNAFNGCSSLITIRIPESVLAIGNDAFYNCSKLARITMPSNVLYIATNAFPSNFVVSYSNNGRCAGNYVYSRGFEMWHTGSDPLPQAVALVPGTPVAGNGEMWFRIAVPEDGSAVTVFTEGRTDTYIRIYDLIGNELANDDDSGSGYNARVETFVQTQTCYVNVRGNGDYSIAVSLE
jgi:hypothetical protein